MNKIELRQTPVVSLMTPLWQTADYADPDQIIDKTSIVELARGKGNLMSVRNEHRVHGL